MAKSQIRLHNTLTRSKEVLNTERPDWGQDKFLTLKQHHWLNK